LADLINPKKAGMKGKKAAGNRNAKLLKEPKEEPTKYEVGESREYAIDYGEKFGNP
jgi:hypothetical protein